MYAPDANLPAIPAGSIRRLLVETHCKACERFSVKVSADLDTSKWHPNQRCWIVDCLTVEFMLEGTVAIEMRDGHKITVKTTCKCKEPTL